MNINIENTPESHDEIGILPEYHDSINDINTNTKFYRRFLSKIKNFRLTRRNDDNKPIKDYPSWFEWVERLFYILVCYLLVVLTVYLRDQPRFGGANRTCQKMHYSAPEISKNNATYPFPNTFNVGRELDWSGANSPSAFQNVQQFGTHNSYHVRNRPGSGTFWASWFFWVWPIVKKWAPSFDYEYEKFENQLDAGYRTFELDLHVKENGVTNYHLQMWDQDTHCYCLGECLQIMKRWSLDNSGHGPIIVMLEPKYKPIVEESYTVFNKISLESLLDVEQEIINIIGSKSLITPDQIRIDEKTSLAESLRTRGWPSVYHLTDTFMFVLWDQRRIRELYEAGTRGGLGRIIFTTKFIQEFDDPKIKEDNENRVVIHGDDPLDELENVKSALSQNQLIRVRVTTQSEPNFSDDKEKIDAVIANGQQIISADQFLDEAFEAIKVGCQVVENLGGSTCLREV